MASNTNFDIKKRSDELVAQMEQATGKTLKKEEHDTLVSSLVLGLSSVFQGAQQKKPVADEHEVVVVDSTELPTTTTNTEHTPAILIPEEDEEFEDVPVDDSTPVEVATTPRHNLFLRGAGAVVQVAKDFFSAISKKLFHTTPEQNVEKVRAKVTKNALTEIAMKTTFATAQKDQKRADIDGSNKQAAKDVVLRVQQQAAETAEAVGKAVFEQGLASEDFDPENDSFVNLGLEYMGYKSIEELEDKYVAVLIAQQGNDRHSKAPHTNVQYVVAELAYRRVYLALEDPMDLLAIDSQKFIERNLEAMKANLLANVPEKSSFSKIDHKKHIQNMIYGLSKDGIVKDLVDRKKEKLGEIRLRALANIESPDEQYRLAGEIFKGGELLARAKSEQRQVDGQVEVLAKAVEQAKGFEERAFELAEQYDDLSVEYQKVHVEIEKCDQIIKHAQEQQVLLAFYSEIHSNLNQALEKLNAAHQQRIEVGRTTPLEMDQLPKEYAIYRELAKELEKMPDQYIAVGQAVPESLQAFLDLNERINSGEQGLLEDFVSLGRGLQTTLPKLAHSIQLNTERTQASLVGYGEMMRSAQSEKAELEKKLPELYAQAVEIFDEMEGLMLLSVPSKSEERGVFTVNTRKIFSELRENPFAEGVTEQITGVHEYMQKQLQALRQQLDLVEDKQDEVNDTVESLDEQLQKLRKALTELNEADGVTDKDLLYVLPKDKTMDKAIQELDEIETDDDDEVDSVVAVQVTKVSSHDNDQLLPVDDDEHTDTTELGAPKTGEPKKPVTSVTNALQDLDDTDDEDDLGVGLFD